MKLTTIQRILSILAIGILAVQGAAQSFRQIPDSNSARAGALWEETIKAKEAVNVFTLFRMSIVSKVNIEAPQRLGPNETRKRTFS